MKYVVSVEDINGRKFMLTNHVYETYWEAQVAIFEIKEGEGFKEYIAYSILQTDNVEKSWQR